MSSLPPGPTTPAVIQIARWLRDPFTFMDECSERFGDTFTIRWPLHAPNVFVSDPAAVKEVFTADPADAHAGQGNAILRTLLGDNSLLILDGARHLRERRLMLPPFHGERMRAYGEVMLDITRRAVAGWAEGSAVSIHREMQAVTLEVILRAVFGLTRGPRLERMREVVTRFVNLSASPVGTAALFLLPPARAREILLFGSTPFDVAGRKVDVSPLLPWSGMVKAGLAMDELLYAEIAEIRASGSAGREDVLAMLVDARDEEGRSMSDVELRDQMATLLLAGHETSATTLAWTVHYVLQNPGALAAIRDEIAQVAGTRPLAADDIGKLEYLEATIKEALRLSPIVPIVARILQRPMRIAGLDLPAGTSVMPCIYLAHRREESWPDAGQFRPERFVGKKADPYAYFPFGGGTRRCLGMAFAMFEMKAVLAELLATRDLTVTPGPAVKPVRRGVTLAPSGGVEVVATARPNAAAASAGE